MNPSGSEKAERGSKRREGNEPSRVPSISLLEGSGALRGMGDKVRHASSHQHRLHDGA